MLPNLAKKVEVLGKLLTEQLERHTADGIIVSPSRQDCAVPNGGLY